MCLTEVIWRRYAWRGQLFSLHPITRFVYAVRGRRSIVMYGKFLGVFLCVESKSVETFCGTLLQIPILSKKLENGFSDFAFQSSYFFVRALCVVLKSMIGCRIVWGTFWYIIHATSRKHRQRNGRKLKGFKKTEKFEFRAITLEIEEIAFRPWSKHWSAWNSGPENTRVEQIREKKG